jgi:hypothetical protein
MEKQNIVVKLFNNIFYGNEQNIIKDLINNIIDGNNQYIIDYIAKEENIPQICLYYCIGTKNLELCKLCLDNGCTLDDFSLKMAFLLHDPELLSMFIRNRYEIPNEYIKYLFRYDIIDTIKTTGTEKIPLKFNKDSMYDITRLKNDISNFIYDCEPKNSLIKKKVFKSPFSIEETGLLPLMAKTIHGYFYEHHDGYAYKFLSFPWYKQKYGVEFYLFDPNKIYHRFRLEIDAVNDCLDLLVKHNKLVIDDTTKIFIIKNQIYKHRNINDINEYKNYDKSLLFHVLYSTINKKKILKKDINLLKNIIKKCNITNVQDLPVVPDAKQFFGKYIFAADTNFV